MKRGRTEEIQFGQPRVQPPTVQQRIITTTQSHNVGGNTGTTIQYQIPPNVIKTTTTPSESSVNVVTNLSTQSQQQSLQQHQQQQQQATQQQQQQLVSNQQPGGNVQYTTAYNSTLGSNLAKSQQTTNPQQAPQPQQQQIHVVNATNQVRSTPGGHKGAVVNATSVAANAVTTNNNASTTVAVSGGLPVLTTTMSPGVLPGSTGNAAGQGPPPPPQGATLQRLKVEDALSYLDQVKYRFSNQPQVYNDFLDIMKEFKSQSIDTPGVIQRVSNLFRGHPELIVGFNTFLPPGYKIEVQANDQGCYLFQVSVSVQPTASSGGTSVAPQPSPQKYNTIFQGGGQIVGSGGGGTAGGGTNVSSAGGGGASGAVNLMAYGGGGHAATAAPGAASVPVHGGTPLQQPSGGSAGGNASPATAQNAQPLSTTTATAATGPAASSTPQLPQNFSSRGDHHRERTISTGSVASNTSLPMGVTPTSTAPPTLVTPVDATAGGGSGATALVTGQQHSQSSNIHRLISQQIISHQPQPTVPVGGIIPTSMVTAVTPTQVQHHQQTTVQQVQPPPEAQTAAATGTVLPTPTATANQPVEFNHAITYVNKIKNRFHTQPEKYKRFLEILHTYQKEQKTYKEGAQSGCMTSAKQLTEAEVYTQVAQLFDNQDDLLREFGQFLPDATSHHNQAAMQQQHHLASGKGGSNSHNLVLNSSLHDHQHQQHQQSHQQQSQQQLGGSAGSGGAVVNLGGVTTGSVVHGGGSGGKKLGSSGVVGASAIANLKVYNSMQPANMARLQPQDRDYSSMGSDGVGVGIHGSTVPGGGIMSGGSHSIPVAGGGAIRAGASGTIQVGAGAVMMEKDRNHHMGGVSGPSGVSLNAKYIHGTTMASMGPAGGLVSGGSTLTPGGPNIVSNVMSSLTVAGVGAGVGVNAIKRSPSYGSQITLVGPGGGPVGTGNSMGSRDRGDGTGPPPMKRHKPICRDVSLAEASKYGTLNDYAFFDKVRKALRSPEVYENFLRCLTLYNQEIVSKSELQTLITPFLARFPDLLKWFQDFLGPSTALGVSGSGPSECIPMTAAAAAAARQDRDRTQSELAADVDLSTCKRLGASYCALPKSHESVKCSGRTSLCRDVLNDTWVSFPTWAEDSTFVTSRKTQYEEFIYRCEDERFELDVVIETNSATIRVLEGVQKKLTRMSPDEVGRFRLDDCLGGTSPTIHQRALRRIYGDKSADIIQGLKKNPSVAVPVVLRRMKAKEEEWREAQKSFNKQWREQNEKYYLKSLDHQGINFKQTDIKALRSKSLFNEIETLFDERHEQNDDSAVAPQASGPHMTLPYKDKTILEDAANLLIHHVKRQTGIQKQEKARIKHILRQFVPDLFFAPRQQLSEDEREEDDKDADMEQDDDASTGKSSTSGKKTSSITSSFVGVNSSSSCNLANSSSNVLVATSSSSESVAMATASDAPKDEEGGSVGADCGTSSKPISSSSSSATEEIQPAAPTPSVTTAPSGSESPAVVSKPAESNGNNSASGDTEDGSANQSMTIKTEIKEENDVAAVQDPTSSTTLNMSIGTSSQQEPMSPPLPPHAISKHIEEAYTLFFTNNSWYLFLRLHAILCERLRTIYERAQIIAAEERAYESTRNNSTATALRLKPKSEIRIEEYYNIFLDMLKNLLDGNMESSSYEDTLREMFGIHAYIAFTLDRVVQNAVRQLQHCVTERVALECVELYQAEQRRGGAGGLCRTANRRIAAELAYQRKAEAALPDENCFKIYIYKIDCRVTMELLDTESDDTANNFTNSQAYSSYVDRLSNPAATGTGSDSGGGGSGVGGGGGGGGSAGVGGASGGGSVGGSVASSGSAVVVDTSAIGAMTAGGGNSANNNHGGSGPAGTTSGSSNTVAGNSGTSAGSTEVKTEGPDDELKRHQPTDVPRRRPLFLPRGLRKRRRHMQEKVSVTIDGRSASMAELQGSDVEENATPVGRKSPAPSAASGAKLKPRSASDGGDTVGPECTSNDASSSRKSPQGPCHDEGSGTASGPTGGGSSATQPNLSSTTKDATGINNNNNVNNVNNNNNSIGSSKQSDNPPAWFEGSGGKKPSPSSNSAPERLPGVNGAECKLLYIDDSEEMKVNRTFKTSQVQKKKFTMYWRGSLARSMKIHCRVTKDMNRKFNAFNNRWLDQNASASQRASCADWLLGKGQDLVKNVTSLVVQDYSPNRTPYAPYNRYKVDKLEKD